ncbi:imidazolonepropionase [Chloroflexota bacterium]
MKLKADIIVDHASELVTVAGASDRPKTGKAISELGIIEDGVVAIFNDNIVGVGNSQVIHSRFEVGNVISAKNKTVLPGLIDSHTHLIFAPLTHSGYETKITGESYSGIHKQGGGIFHTVECTRAASTRELLAKAMADLEICLLHGTTTLEAKSGYGLDRANELKILKCLKKLKQLQPVSIVTTYLGAHTIPLEYQHDRESYIRLITSMLSEIKDKGLAEYCDVFCDKLGFSVKESQLILEAARQNGLKQKIHSEQTGYLGSAEMAAKLGVTSADHLDFVCEPQKIETGYHLTNRHVERLAQAGVVATLLPGATYHSMEMTPGTAIIKGFLPETVRALITGGAAVALATNYNPSSSRTRSMQTIMELAARLYRMSYAEIINATTINAAHALDRARSIGSIEPGKRADIVIFDCLEHGTIIEDFGVNMVDKVIVGGKLVVDTQSHILK